MLLAVVSSISSSVGQYTHVCLTYGKTYFKRMVLDSCVKCTVTFNAGFMYVKRTLHLCCVFENVNSEEVWKK